MRTASPITERAAAATAGQVLLYKGELPVDSVLTVGPTGEMSVTDATGAYGVGNWHLYNGRRAEAERVFRRILAGSCDRTLTRKFWEHTRLTSCPTPASLSLARPPRP